MVKKSKTNLVFLGAPGSGKGTLASIIIEQSDIVHLSTGNIFRAEIAMKTDLGKKIKSLVESGHYVPDEITNEVVRQRLEKIQKDKRHVILDGYPRTINQAEFLDSLEGFDYKTVFLDVSEDIILKRLGGRRFCPSCKSNFHIEFMPSKKGSKCDKCDTELIKRKDDSDESIKERLIVYETQTKPILDYYKDRLNKFDSGKDAKIVANEILKKFFK